MEERISKINIDNLGIVHWKDNPKEYNKQHYLRNK